MKTLRNSAANEGSELDELIQLKDLTYVKNASPSMKDVRFVQFSNPKDIIPLMNGEQAESAPQPKSKLRAEAAPFVPASLLAPDEDSDDDEPTEAQQEDDDAGIDHTVDLDAAARTVDAARVEQVFAPPTADEIRAAKLISSLYRRLRSRRQGKPKKGLPEARNRWFTTCQEKAQNMNTGYRLLFLGPLPHALVCTEKLDSYSNEVRKKALLRVHAAGHADLERIKVEVDEATYVLP